MNRVDIVVPCYKYGHYLRGCVESVLGQQGVEVRILILDDASPDHTPEVAAELVGQDSRVEYRRHESNKRHVDTYNEGLLEWASADYSLLLSADDVLAPGALRRATAVMASSPDVVMVHGQQLLITDSPPPVERDTLETDSPATIVRGEEFVKRCCTGGDNPVATPTVVVRTALQHKIGGYRKSLPHSCDMEMWLRFAARGAVGYVAAIQAFKRMHQSNMQYQYLGGRLGDLKERYETFVSFFREDGHLLQAPEQLRAQAMKSLGEQAFWIASSAFDSGDNAECEHCLAEALRIYPDLAAAPQFNRLRWKRRLGRRGWSVLRPIVEWVRGRKSPAHSW